MVPIIALVGATNVGKSTLFNFLTRSRDALVADFPGLTRDRQYGIGRVGDYSYRVIDTGGFTGERNGLCRFISDQAEIAIHQSDAVLFIVDTNIGLTNLDIEIADQLRRVAKPVFLVINKAEGQDKALATAEFTQLGFADPMAISALHGQGINNLIARIGAAIPISPDNGEGDTDRPTPWVAVVGRPNVGKSTLINQLIGEERLLATDQPGTTRDSIYVPFVSAGRNYTLIDTAGIRRRPQITDVIEKFSVIKSLQAIDQAHAVILLLDAQHGITDQDRHLVGQILEAGRGLVVAINKWDKLDMPARSLFKKQLERHFPFLDFVRFHYISALQGSGLDKLLPEIDRIYETATRAITTPLATQILHDATITHPPPLIYGRRIKLRFAHQGGRNPLRIIIHGNQIAIPDNYRRYLINAYRSALQISGVPLILEFKRSANPFMKK